MLNGLRIYVDTGSQKLLKIFSWEYTANIECAIVIIKNKKKTLNVRFVLQLVLGNLTVWNMTLVISEAHFSV